MSDRDREHAAESLREHAAAGRLTFDELGDRLQATFTASTQAELDQQFADLPRASRVRRNRQADAKRTGLRIHTAAYLLVSLAMIAIWAASSSRYFWPAWPILAGGLGMVIHLFAYALAIRPSSIGPRDTWR